jgi:hypothetical protein
MVRYALILWCRKFGFACKQAVSAEGGQLRAHLTVITCEGELDLIFARARKT